MKNLVLFLWCSLVLLLLLPSLAFAELKISIGNIEVIPDVMYKNRPSIQFNVFNVKISEGKGKTIHFGFNISQKKAWLEGAWVSYEAQTIKLSEASWKGPLTFYYYLDYLKENGDAAAPFYGSFFVVDTNTTQELARKDVEFWVKADAVEQVAPAEKNLGAYMDEAVNRLLTNPEVENFKWDPLLFGDWEGLQLISAQYKVIDKFIRFNEDGTGHMEVIPLYLKKNGALKPENKEATVLDFYWGVEVVYEQKQPVTLIKVVAQNDENDFAWYGYVVFDEKKIGLIYYDPGTGKYDDITYLNSKADFDEDWNKNFEKLRLALYENYKTKKAMDEMLFMTNYMGWQNSWMGLMGAAGSWFAAPAVY